jgi:hypothetical protein
LDDTISYDVLYSPATRYSVLLLKAGSGNMLFTGGSRKMEQQITTKSSPAEAGENNLLFSIDISILCTSSGEQKASTDTASIEWPGAEFSQTSKALVVSQASTHSVQSDQGGPDGHPCRNTGYTIDPGSSHC